MVQIGGYALPIVESFEEELIVCLYRLMSKTYRLQAIASKEGPSSVELCRSESPAPSLQSCQHMHAMRI